MFSEIILSAYPLLIKLVDASVIFQTGLRMIIFTVLATLAALATKSPILAANLFSQETILTGLLNLLHVGTSYTAFEQLAAGNAMALFYTYPVWNIIGAAAILQETISIKSMPWIGLALMGAILLAQPSVTNWTLIGVVAALTAAITETGIYLWFRMKKEDEGDQPWTKMIQMYGGSSMLWALAIILASIVGVLGKNVFKINQSSFVSILLFNSLIGFVGYALRFYVIPKVSTIAFSSLSFIGVVAAYLMGWIFANEVPTFVQGLGAVAIVIANTVLLRREIV